MAQGVSEREKAALIAPRHLLGDTGEWLIKASQQNGLKFASYNRISPLSCVRTNGRPKTTVVVVGGGNRFVPQATLTGGNKSAAMRRFYEPFLSLSS